MPSLAPVGLDIGSVSIRAIEVTRAKDKPVINNFGQAELPEGAMVGGVVKDERAVANVLRQLWAHQAFKSKSVVVGVTHQQVVVREVEISNLPPKELRKALPFQVRDVLPLPPEQAMLDFYPLEKAEKKDTVRGLLIAAPKEAVLALVRAVEKAGLHVEKVDLSIFAMLRAVAHEITETEAVVDIGANATNIVIHHGGVPRIVRTIPRGGVEITKLLASRLNISMADAETLKCRVGLIMAGGGEGAEVVEEAIRPLINEIRSSVSYYTSGHPDQMVSQLALVGGASQLPGLTERLSSMLSVPTFVADPLQYVGDSRRGGRHDLLGKYRTSAAVAIGLTLAAA
jgi:type IV pilus assembly protein PilM